MVGKCYKCGANLYATLGLCLSCENDELQAKNKRLKEEIERLKPKPLLFDTIGGFKIIINDDVPEGEIWFATDEQLKMALEFSARQIEQSPEK